MKIFITSDHHFNHKNIIKYCARPFSSVEQMNSVMIERWNKKVTKEDIVIHLGDFAFGSSEKIGEIRKKLNGTVFLIAGNHESCKKMKDAGFVVIRGSIQIENFILSHRPLPQTEIPKGFINVHGHIHQKESLHGINVSVEKTGYEPVEISEINKIKELKTLNPNQLLPNNLPCFKLS